MEPSALMPFYGSICSDHSGLVPAAVALAVCVAIAVNAEPEEPYTITLPLRIYMNVPAPRMFSMPPCVKSFATAT